MKSSLTFISLASSGLICVYFYLAVCYRYIDALNLTGFRVQGRNGMEIKGRGVKEGKEDREYGNGYGATGGKTDAMVCIGNRVSD